MALAADVLGEREVIFPEVAALALGLWIADKRMWNVRGYEIPLIMTISAVLGVLITTYLHVHVFWQLTLALVLSALMMTAMRIPLIPAIAAILLPVLLHTESWYYPASVAIMTTIMAVGTTILQRVGLKSKLPDVTHRQGLTTSAVKSWLTRYILLFHILLVASLGHWLYAIVPPLVIILIELVNPENMFRNRPVALWIAVVIVASIGTLSRYFLLETFSLPYIVAVYTAFLIAILLLNRKRLMFPPVPALAIIPFILPGTYEYFPLAVAIGGAYVIAVPLIYTRFLIRR